MRLGGLMASDDFHEMGGLIASDDLGVPLDCILHQQSGWGGASDDGRVLF